MAPKIKTKRAQPLPEGMLKLPVLVFGIVEVRRLKRELEALEDFMKQSEIREPGKQPSIPRVSRLLDALAAENHLNLLQPQDRQRLKEFLVYVEHGSPRVHMSFATDPSSAFTAKIVSWLRASVSPDVLLEIGLQPNIAAGAILRTKNKIFDLSLRERFAESNQLLMQAFAQEAGDVVTAQAQAPQAPVVATAAPAQNPIQAVVQPQALVQPQPATVAAAPPAAASTAQPVPQSVPQVVQQPVVRESQTPATHISGVPA